MYRDKVDVFPREFDAGKKINNRYTVLNEIKQPCRRRQRRPCTFSEQRENKNIKVNDRTRVQIRGRGREEKKKKYAYKV